MEDSVSKIVDLTVLILLIAFVPVMMGKRYSDRLNASIAKNLSEQFLERIEIFARIEGEKLEDFRDGMAECAGMCFRLEHESLFYLPGEVCVKSVEILPYIEEMIAEKGTYALDYGDIVRLTVTDRRGNIVFSDAAVVRGLNSGCFEGGA